MRSAAATTTETMLVSILQQMLLGGTLAKKHGENVITGYADKVKPDALAPVRSRILARHMREENGGNQGAGAGAAAAVMSGPPAIPPEG